MGGDHTPGAGKPDDDPCACHSAPVGWEDRSAVDEERCFIEKAIVFHIVSHLRNTHVFQSLGVMAVMV